MNLDLVLEFIPALISIIALLITTYIAFYSIRHNSKLIGRRASVEMIRHVESTKEYREAQKSFNKYTSTQTLSKLNAPTTDEQDEDRRIILWFLNQYEMISLAILKDFLDEDIYRDWMQSTFLVDWNLAADFIQRERWKLNPKGKWLYRERLYYCFQTLAERWGEERQIDVQRIHKNSTKPPIEPAGIGDHQLLHPKKRFPGFIRRAA